MLLGCSSGFTSPHRPSTTHQIVSYAKNEAMAECIAFPYSGIDILALDAALLSDSDAASDLVTRISDMRSSGVPDIEIAGVLDNLLSVVDGREGKGSPPLWATVLPLARLSKRARRASLRRLLDLITPEASEGTDDDDEAMRRRRRRSLVVVLRSLANPDDKILSRGTNGLPAVTILEKAAKMEAKASIQSEDLQSRLPDGLETPEYTVLAQSPKHGYEIRRYEPFSLCSVSMTKPRPEAATSTDAQISNPQLPGASAFGALAGYLFGKNKQKTAMKMTTPVISSGDGQDRQMSFVLPSKFWDEKGTSNAPKPLDDSGVVLQRDEGGDKAALMFGGYSGKKVVEQRTEQLLNGLEKDKEWMAKVGAPVTLAQYNDPFTPPWKRRNEVAVTIVPRKQSP